MTRANNIPENHDISSGSRIGQYRIIRKVGSGGAGDVYLCRHLVLDKSYAIKVLNHLRGESGVEAEGRMLREARIARRIRHRNLVSVLDAHPAMAGNPAYIVMEYVDGETLEDLLKGGVIPENAALYICRCVALVLAEAEKHGIVHRDIKPSNILIDRNGDVKVNDLGIAKVDPASAKYDEPVTREEHLLGTPDYASPEQLRDSRSVDIRADIYSLGATMYHMLSGKKPFEAQGVFNLMAKVLETEPVDLTEYGISPDIARLVRRMMEKNPDDRPRNARALITELRKVSGRRGNKTDIKAFLSGSVRQIFSVENIKIFTRIRNAFIIAGAVASGLMIFLHFHYKYGPDGNAGSEKLRSAVENRSESGLLKLYNEGKISGNDIIHETANINEVKSFDMVKRLFPALITDKKYAKQWLDLLSDKKHRKLLNALLKSGFDVNAARAGHLPAAFRKELFTDAELLRMLISHGLDVTLPDDRGATVLIHMARRRSSTVQCAELFLRAGVPLNARDKNNKNALHASAVSGNTDLMRFFLNKKIMLTAADIEAIPDIYRAKSELAAKIAVKSPERPASAVAELPKKEKPEKRAAKSRIPETVAEKKSPPSPEFLSKQQTELEKVSRLAARRKELARKYDEALSRQYHDRMKAYLNTAPSGRAPTQDDRSFINDFISKLESGKLSPDIYVGKSRTHLLDLISQGKLYPARRLFKALLAAGADPDSVAMPANDIVLCRMLLEYGKSRFSPGDILIFLAPEHCDFSGAKVLLLRGADPAAADKQTGENAFHRAAALGSRGLLKVLLTSGKSGAGVSDKRGFTPYQTAVFCGKSDAAKLLADAGHKADVSSVMRNTGSLFDAIERDDAAETSYFLTLDADVLFENGLRLNAVQYAVSLQSNNSLDVLLQNGVSPSRYRGSSPLELALQNYDDEAFVKLLRAGADCNTKVRDKFGRDSLLFTSVFRYLDGDPEKLENCFQAMIECGWDPASRTPDGDTAESWMGKWNEGNTDIVELLKQNRKNPAVKQ